MHSSNDEWFLASDVAFVTPKTLYVLLLGTELSSYRLVRVGS